MKYNSRKTLFLISLVVLLMVVGYINVRLTSSPKDQTAVDYEKYEKGLADLNGSNINSSNTDETNNTEETSGSEISEGNSSEVVIVDSNDEKVEDLATETGSIIDELISKEEHRKSVNYYVEYRINRDKLRASLIQNIQFIIDNEHSTEEMKKEAQAKIIELVDIAQQELYIEELIKSKGFDDALVFINEDTARVVVEISELTAVDVAKILDIVIEQTNLNANNITIMKRF